MQTFSSHPLWNIQAISEILTEASANAIAYRWGADWILKDDGSLVTAIDGQNEMLLKERLTELIPGSFFLGEETIQNCGKEYMEKAFKGDCWVVDPIDGTSSFAHGFPLWGVSIGLLHNGKLIDGAVALPALGEIFITNGPDVLYARTIDFAKRIPVIPAQKLPVQTDRVFSFGGLFLLGQKFTKLGQLPLPNPVIATGSAVQAIAYLLLGHAMAYIGGMKLWDIAGVLPMMARLDIQAKLLSGMEIETDILNGAFILDLEDEHCWYIRDTFRIAPPKVMQTIKEKLG